LRKGGGKVTDGSQDIEEGRLKRVKKRARKDAKVGKTDQIEGKQRPKGSFASIGKRGKDRMGVKGTAWVQPRSLDLESSRSCGIADPSLTRETKKNTIRFNGILTIRALLDLGGISEMLYNFRRKKRPQKDGRDPAQKKGNLGTKGLTTKELEWAAKKGEEKQTKSIV